MAGRGRIPKPANLRVVQGNPGKREIKDSCSPPVAKPEVPKDLSAEAKVIWVEVVDMLVAQRVITALDAHILESYCENLAKIRKCRKVLKDGLTYKTHGRHGEQIKTRPEVNILAEAERQHRALSSELGLTPASRTRLPNGNQGDLFGDKKSKWDID